MGERLFMGRAVQGQARRLQQICDRLIRRRRRARFIEMMGDRRRLVPAVRRGDPLDGVGYADVQAMAARRGKRFGQCLPDQLVHETVAYFPPGPFRRDQLRTLGFFNGFERGAGPRTFEFFQQAQAKGTVDHGTSRQHTPRRCVQGRPVELVR